MSSCKLENATILRDFLNVWSWRQKRSNSARLRQFLNWTTSKTKQFCETSSIFEVDNVKNDAILRDFLQTRKVECRADGLVPMRFVNSLLHLSKVLRLPRKSDAKSYEALHLSRKIILANLKIWCSKMQPLSGNQRPDLLTSLMNMSLVLRLPCEMHLPRSSSNVPRLPSFLEMLPIPHISLAFDKVHNPLRLPCKTTSERPKVLRSPSFFTLLTSKCVSCHNGVHSFDMSTSKSGLRMVCLVHFDLEMCFAPQRRALFRQLNFQKCSARDALWNFSIPNVLRAKTACNFSSLIWPDGSAPAASASLLFDPPEPQIIGKTKCFATFLPFRTPGSSFFWLLLFADLLFSLLLFADLLFSSLLFSSLLWLFPPLLFICPYCRKFDF